MKAELEQYKVEPDPLWNMAPFYDGYEMMEIAEKRRWRAIAGWGTQGWDLGSWPYVVIYFRDREGLFDVLEYSEGDVTMYACPSKEIREQITNELAFFHWKHTGNGPDVSASESVEQLPQALRGPEEEE